MAIVMRRRQGLIAAIVLGSLLASGTAEARRRTPASCRGEIGQAGADDLLRQCREVSLASRSPCNARNSCAVLRGEIRQGCELLGSDAPALCRSYVDNDEIEDDEESDE